MNAWNSTYAWEILPDLCRAALTTIAAALAGYAIAIAGGFVLAIAQRSPWRLLTTTVREAVDFIRSTPLLVQVFFLFYVGPQLGINLSAWQSGLMAIGLHYSAYLSEVYRAGLDSIPKGQWEACTAFNMSPVRIYTRIMVPQALPICIPGLGNYLIGIFKDTPMLSVIGVGELLHTANEVGTLSYRYLEPYSIAGLIFLAISLPAAFLMNQLEAVFRRHQRTRP